MDADPHSEFGPRRRLYGSCFLASGAALVVYIVSGISLPLTFGFVLLGALVGGLCVRRSLIPPRRSDLDRHVKVGLLAGAGGLIAYDSTRWALVHFAHFRLRPFDTFSIYGRAMMGQAIVGPAHSRWWITGVGVAFHLANGLGFAVAYTMWLGRRGWKAGVAFAFGLQLVMLGLYPTWLRVRLLSEFVQVAMIGHVAYGAVLGLTARHILARQKVAEDAGL